MKRQIGYDILCLKTSFFKGDRMKLKTRLIIAFFVIILVPFMLFGVTLWGFTRYQKQTVEDSYGISVSVENFTDSMRLIGQATQDIFEKMEKHMMNKNQKRSSMRVNATFDEVLEVLEPDELLEHLEWFQNQIEFAIQIVEKYDDRKISRKKKVSTILFSIL